MRVLKKIDNIPHSDALNTYCDSLSQKVFGRYSKEPLTLEWHIEKSGFLYRAHLKWHVGSLQGRVHHEDRHLRSSVRGCLKKANRSYTRWRLRKLQESQLT